MLTLCIDTSYKMLSLCIIEDDVIISRREMECFKRQSEEVFVMLENMLLETKGKVLDIDSICIAIGPGSYTGVRIALTIAKVIASVKQLDLYTISTLRLYADYRPTCAVVLDARAGRAYVGIYDKDEILFDDCVCNTLAINLESFDIVGDASMFGKPDNFPSICECFLHTKSLWHKEKDIDHLQPVYLKDNKDYLK